MTTIDDAITTSASITARAGNDAAPATGNQTPASCASATVGSRSGRIDGHTFERIPAAQGAGVAGVHVRRRPCASTTPERSW